MAETETAPTPDPAPEDHKGRPDGERRVDPETAKRQMQKRNLPTHDWPGKGAA